MCEWIGLIKQIKNIFQYSKLTWKNKQCLYVFLFPRETLFYLNSCGSGATWSSCVAAARIKFQKYFNFKAQQLTTSFPPDAQLTGICLVLGEPEKGRTQCFLALFIKSYLRCFWLQTCWVDLLNFYKYSTTKLMCINWFFCLFFEVSCQLQNLKYRIMHVFEISCHVKYFFKQDFF